LPTSRTSRRPVVTFSCLCARSIWHRLVFSGHVVGDALTSFLRTGCS
jgi:hypothetical protein